MSVIENIEGGRRKDGKRRRQVTVDELLGLALGLDVSPLVLLFPEEGGSYPIGPKASSDAGEIYRWLAGQREHRPGTTSEPVTARDEEAAWSRLRHYLPWLPQSPYLEHLRMTDAKLGRLINDEGEINIPLDSELTSGKAEGDAGGKPEDQTDPGR